MSDGTVGVFDESGAGTKAVDTTEVVVGGNTVERERIVLTGEAPDEIARVHDAAPGASDMALVVRPIVTAGMEADGHSATLGTTTDAAVTTSAAGTVSAKLRGLIAILADVWDAVAHKLRVDTGLTQPLTDAQLRASSVPVTVSDGSGPLTVDGTVATTVADGADATLGALADAAVTTNTSGSVSAKLRGLVTIFADVWDSVAHKFRVDTGAKPADFDTGAGTDTVPMFGVALPKSGGAVAGGTSTDPFRVDPTGTTAQPITDNGGSLTVDGTVATTVADAANVALGATTDAAVDTDANGTANAHLRGLVKTTGAAADAAVTTNTTGSVSAKLRGLVAIFADVWDSTNHWLKVQVQASENYIGAVGHRTTTAFAFFTRPADTTPYATGDIVANSVTAGSVTPLTFTNVLRSTANTASSTVAQVRLVKTGTSLTNALFRLHLYKSTLTPSNGDNGAYLTSNGGGDYLGFADIACDMVFTTVAGGRTSCCIPLNNAITADTSVYGLLEARAAYTPISGEQLFIYLDVEQH
jgi:hypothetical protein